MARRADFDVQVLAQRRPRRELVAARANDLDDGVIRMDFWLHDRAPERARKDNAGPPRTQGEELADRLSTQTVNNSVEIGVSARRRRGVETLSGRLVKQ